MSIGVKKVAQTKFDIVAAGVDMPGNLFQNQDGPQYLSTKGAMAAIKVSVSKKRLMYFMKVILEGLS